ncbi:MAG: RagB/SusD family nutrient uptake outer membrane protein [Williamsia sp.]|nr:RagB/SusD family nutrient uptake outer membrane protein [Williamsia sp.]
MKRIFQYFTIASMAVALYSCDRDLLNPAPQTAISDTLTAFDKPYRIANQVTALYTSLKGGAFYGGRYLVYGDIRGEDFLNLTNNLITNADVWGLYASSSATAVTGLWAQAYRTINSCNLFIDGMNTTGTAVVGTALSNNYLAEARLIRGLSYYSLLQYYARPYADGNGSKLGLPLRLKGISTLGNSDMARSTVAEVYAQVLSDLNFAETNLPLTNGTAVLNTTRAHRNTAIALKTRVYLSMQKYGDVITEANKIVPAAAPFTATTGVRDSLQADITTVFKTPYTSTESIFSLPFTTNTGDVPGTQNGLQIYYFASSTGASSEFSLNPNGILANTGWKTTDKRRSFIYTNTAGTRFLNKFPTASPADNSPVIRYAEVLLNLAEAKVRSTNTVDAQAVALLNAVRMRSDPTTSFTAASFATPTDLINAILLERRIEFLGEGLRNNDLMRLLQTIPAKGSAPSKTPNDDGYIWPASSAEKSLNKLWKDN